MSEAIAVAEMSVPFLDLGRAHAPYAAEIEARLRRVAESGHYVLGPNVSEFEKAAAEYLGVKHAVGVASGTDALHLALIAAGIGPGDEVITTPFTFAATAEAIQYVGGTPVLVDIDPGTFNIDVNLVERAITPKTRAILPVHLFGLPADMTRIMRIAEAHGLEVIEDCAQSLGARVGDRETGSIGTANAFSMYPTKTLGAYGDAGMVTTNSADIDRVLRELRNHGIGKGGEHGMLGFNSRLDEMQAAVLCVKLPQLDAMNERRREIATHYNDVFAGKAQLQQLTEDDYHVYGYYTMCVPNRDSLREKLKARGVATALYYGKPLHAHKHFAGTCRFEAMPNAEQIAGEAVSLPVFPEMTDAEVDYVASTTASLLS